jgi:hypothetical protein
MKLSLNRLFEEAYEASSELQKKLESIYPIEFNVHFSSLSVMSIRLTKIEQTLASEALTHPQFSLSLDSATTLYALRHQNIPAHAFEGDSELALMFFLAIKESNVDLEVLIYKHLGTIPALITRSFATNTIKSHLSQDGYSRAHQLQAALRAMAIRVDRLEQVITS